ncbi:PorT family protein [Lutimonas saemankumensis]|uniref:porin family protein n=1 Tax=Lutimonas saemankumensis TaxID=483016 RepID=UPI001CD6D2B5|nr:porin family protein [Lutimonas saemankumensis]MCA0931978.1 PorT family protein [Lutimonas saemankumensis]
MKYKVLLVFFLFISISMQSQVLIALLLGKSLNTGKIEFGLDGGVNYATLGGMESDSYYRKWNLGFYFDIKIKNQWYLNTGVLVKSELGLDDLTESDLEFLGATIHDEEGEYSQSISYFLVPALARYKFDNHMYAELGPQFGLAHRASIKFYSKIDDIEINAQENNLGMINRFDMGIAAGAGYRLLKGLGWTIGARYYYGFLDVYKDRSGTNNSALFLKVNAPIGLSDEKKAQIKEMKNKRAERKKQKKELKKAEKEKNKIENL